MKLFTAAQIRAWDQATIHGEGITGHQLMEKAAIAFCDEVFQQQLDLCHFYIVCGQGNNGGDGLAIARLLYQQNIKVTVLLPALGGSCSADFDTNFRLLNNVSAIPIINFSQIAELSCSIQPNDILIDALLGTGTNRPASGLYLDCIEWMNQQAGKIISVDIPSGMDTDGLKHGGAMVRAWQTFSFEIWKLAFLMPENADFTGVIKILPIGLDEKYYQETPTPYQLVNQVEAQYLLHQRSSFAHKGTFGHALLVAGSYGKMGAAVLSAQACLRSGVGLLSCHIPRCGYNILQSTTPEAMVLTDEQEQLIAETEWQLNNYRAIGIGPGIGTDLLTQKALESLIKQVKTPIVLDADGLNILALDLSLLASIPRGSILTPHLKELERIIGFCNSHTERLTKTLAIARQYELTIIIKGHFSATVLPDGNIYFNNSGNPGMATGGSGDVLTGILTGLLAQTYKPEEAAIFGVYLHGKAGDIAASLCSQPAMLAHDIIEQIGAAYITMT